MKNWRGFHVCCARRHSLKQVTWKHINLCTQLKSLTSAQVVRRHSLNPVTWEDISLTTLMRSLIIVQCVQNHTPEQITWKNTNVATHKKSHTNVTYRTHFQLLCTIIGHFLKKISLDGFISKKFFLYIRSAQMIYMNYANVEKLDISRPILMPYVAGMYLKMT